jgi:hypothetical protein
MAVVCGFYRTCVIDGIWKHFPAAEYVRRPVVPPESPTLGLSRLQFDQAAVDAGGSRGVGTSTDAVAAVGTQIAVLPGMGSGDLLRGEPDSADQQPGAGG